MILGVHSLKASLLGNRVRVLSQMIGLRYHIRRDCMILLDHRARTCIPARLQADLVSDVTLACVCTLIATGPDSLVSSPFNLVGKAWVRTCAITPRWSLHCLTMSPGRPELWSPSA
jgi:hypothetical protein